MRKVIAILLMAAWVVAASYIMILHFQDIEARMEQVRQSRSDWLSTPGTILEVQFHTATDDNDYSSVTVKFQYEAFGSLQVTQQKWGDYTRGYDVANSYRTGQIVTIYYDPNDPGKSVINRESVDLYDVSAWWETLLRIITFPVITIGCVFIWGVVTDSKPAQK